MEGDIMGFIVSASDNEIRVSICCDNNIDSIFTAMEYLVKSLVHKIKNGDEAAINLSSAIILMSEVLKRNYPGLAADIRRANIDIAKGKL